MAANAKAWLPNNHHRGPNWNDTGLNVKKFFNRPSGSGLMNYSKFGNFHKIFVIVRSFDHQVLTTALGLVGGCSSRLQILLKTLKAR